MNTVLQLLDKVERRWSGPNSAARMPINRSVPSEALRAETFRPSFSFSLRMIRPAEYVIENKIIHVHRRELADPFQQSFLPGPSTQTAAKTEDRFSPRSPSAV